MFALKSDVLRNIIAIIKLTPLKFLMQWQNDKNQQHCHSTQTAVIYYSNLTYTYSDHCDSLFGVKCSRLALVGILPVHSTFYSVFHYRYEFSTISWFSRRL